MWYAVKLNDKTYVLSNQSVMPIDAQLAQHIAGLKALNTPEDAIAQTIADWVGDQT